MNYRTVFKYFAVGLPVAVAAFFLLPNLSGQLSPDWAANLLIVGIPFLCLVIVTCTGIIVAHIDKE
ncbi:MAG: hypothetical protein IKP17_02680 [Oscillospiraceae bacterium]|nr:hypothetical protein [Oscillospiraceae bacterium]